MMGFHCILLIFKNSKSNNSLRTQPINLKIIRGLPLPNPNFMYKICENFIRKLQLLYAIESAAGRTDRLPER